MLCVRKGILIKLQWCTVDVHRRAVISGGRRDFTLMVTKAVPSVCNSKKHLSVPSPGIDGYGWACIFNLWVGKCVVWPRRQRHGPMQGAPRLIYLTRDI